MNNGSSNEMVQEEHMNQQRIKRFVPPKETLEDDFSLVNF